MRKRPTLIAGLVLAAALPLAAAAPAAAADPPTPGHTQQQGPFTNSRGIPTPPHHLNHHVPGAIPGDSTNWEGYQVDSDLGKSIRFIQADFNARPVNCQNSHIGTSGFGIYDDWVGIGDGPTGDALAQTGVEGWCTSSGPGATASYAAWYIICCVSGGQLQIPSGFPISANDHLEFSVFYENDPAKTYQFVFTNTTKGTTWTRTQTCPSGLTCTNTAAEVITEDPDEAEPVWDLADFDSGELHTNGPFDFRNTVVTSQDGVHGTLNTINGWWHLQDPITLITNHTPVRDMATTDSSLGTGGQAFFSKWLYSGEDCNACNCNNC
jgi:Peptidase A4 family